MYKIKDILKVLLIALFVCIYGTGNVYAQMSSDLCGCDEGQVCINWVCMNAPEENSNSQPKEETPAQEETKTQEEKTDVVVKGQGAGAEQNATFCGTSGGAFSQLVNTGVLIFKRLRDLIYVVAGFGIIAVAVGGFFGNLNWKWLGAIIISLVVIASAGEIVVMITGCPDFDDKLITNTITAPTSMSTQEFNDNYTESVSGGGWISVPYGGSSSESQIAEEAGLEEMTTE